MNKLLVFFATLSFSLCIQKSLAEEISILGLKVDDVIRIQTKTYECVGFKIHQTADEVNEITFMNNPNLPNCRPSSEGDWILFYFFELGLINGDKISIKNEIGSHIIIRSGLDFPPRRKNADFL